MAVRRLNHAVLYVHVENSMVKAADSHLRFLPSVNC